MFYQGKARHPVREVVLHCAAINTGQFDGMPPLQVFTEINRWHVERGFKNGFGYHGLFMPSGLFYRGRPFQQIGAHTIGRNAGTLGLLLIESRKIQKPDKKMSDEEFLATAKFSDWFTPAQDMALRAILEDLRVSHGVQTISGHNDHAQRLCPGFRVSEWLEP